MDVDLLLRFLGGCALVNYGLLVVWALLVLVARGPWLELQQRLFGLPPEPVRVLNCAGIALYKIGIILFFLVPYLVLRLVR
ncbi:MAG: hypothetical protein KGL43_00760 [Burkholderiales bacterium]|nr:hypothetical protein [Burkholderiales bacterium]MDE2452096.1 hypothetical protein [Burkholderiales bacterium]